MGRLATWEALRRRPAQPRWTQAVQNKTIAKLSDEMNRAALSEAEGFSISYCGEEIDGIPDAAGFQNTISTSQYRHCDAACQSALHTRRDRIRAHWKPMCGPDLPKRVVCPRPSISDEANVFGSHCDSFFLFMRKGRRKTIRRQPPARARRRERLPTCLSPAREQGVVQKPG